MTDATALFASTLTPPAYSGFRRLTDEQIEALAVNIVLEIRKRGPVISLAEFINRSDVSNNGGDRRQFLATPIRPAAVNLPLTSAGE